MSIVATNLWIKNSVINKEPKIFRPSRFKNSILFFGCSLFVAICVYIPSDKPLIHWGGLIFFGIGMLVSLISFHPNATYLKLTDEGFELKSLFRSHFTKWSEVTDLKILSITYKLTTHKFIGYNYTSKHKKWKQGKKISKFLSYKDGVIPNSGLYNIKVEDLLDLMKEYKRNSRQRT